MKERKVKSSTSGKDLRTIKKIRAHNKKKSVDEILNKLNLHRKRFLTNNK